MIYYYSGHEPDTPVTKPDSVSRLKNCKYLTVSM